MSDVLIQEVARVIEERLTRVVNERLGTFRVEIKGDYKLIKRDLEYIKEQTTRTNGRVTQSEEKLDNIKTIVNTQETTILKLQHDSEHRVTNCPFSGNIRELEDKNLTIESIKNHSNKQLIKLSTIIGIIAVLFSIAIYFISR